MLDRKTPPPFVRSTAFNLIQPVDVKLSNGIEAKFISGGQQDVVKIEMIFNAGRWFETKWGLSHFTSSILTKGTQSKNSFQIAETFDRYGAHIEVSPGHDVVSVTLYSLTKNIQPVLELLLEILTQSTFPEKELEQGKSIYLQNLKVNQEKTSFQASKLIRKNIFGESHPYGKELEESDVKDLSRNDLAGFFKNNFTDFKLIVSGKTNSTIESHISKVLSQINIVGSTFSKEFANQAGERVQYVKKDGSVQSSIRMGKKSLLRSNKDYADVLFLNHILGGFFGSRLMKNIREEKGLTYGIHSSIHALQHDSYMMIGADVNSENRDIAFEEIRKELKRLRVEKIAQEEVDTARYHFIGSLQAEITTPFAHAEKIKNILINNLSPSYYQDMISRIDSITPEQLLITAEKYFNEDSYFEVAVG